MRFFWKDRYFGSSQSAIKTRTTKPGEGHGSGRRGRHPTAGEASFRPGSGCHPSPGTFLIDTGTWFLLAKSCSYLADFPTAKCGSTVLDRLVVAPLFLREGGTLVLTYNPIFKILATKLI